MLKTKMFPNVESEWDALRVIRRTIDEGIRVKSSSDEDVYDYYLSVPNEDFTVVVNMFGTWVRNVRKVRREKQ